MCKLNKSDPWEEDNLKEALKHLDKDKSRDPEGFANEIFKEDIAGTDLLKAVLMPMNLMKKSKYFPKF